MESCITVKNLTKDYGHHRGVFDLNLEVPEGECFGYVGTNGSGKTTTIRHMMGFIRPDTGSVSIRCLDAWKDSVKINKLVSYIPGEIAFPPAYTGAEFLKIQAGYMGVTDYSYMNELIHLLQFDVSGSLKSMSKGMKQKTAIVAALMTDKPILIFDEPTTGLDPLMRDVFLDLIEKEKKHGKTIFMSTHIFEEAERLCDRVAMIHEGTIVRTVDMKELTSVRERTYELVYRDGSRRAETVPLNELPSFFGRVKNQDISKMYEQKRNLETIFRETFEKRGQ